MKLYLLQFTFLQNNIAKMPRKRKSSQQAKPEKKVKKNEHEEEILLEQLYGISFPLHIFQFYKFCKQINEAKPLREFYCFVVCLLKVTVFVKESYN